MPPPTKQRSSAPHTASSNEKMEGRRHSSGSSGSGSDSPKLRTGVQQVVHKPPTPATPVLHQQQHAAEANKPSEGAAIVMKHFAANILQKGVAGLAQEFAEIQQLTGKNIPDHEQYSKHPTRNRYTDIYCIDKTRVVLNYPPGDANDYIHANWIRGFPVLGKVDGKDKEIIATQAPLEKTIRDFWRMIWQEKVSVIVMLCQLVEGGRKKADLYWPWAAKDKKKVDNLELEIVNEAVEEDEVKQLRTTSLVVRGRSLKTGELREHRVTHVMWRGWPDKDVPTSSVQAIQLVNKVHGTNSSVVCVHCSAGIGRTGTIVALEIAIRTLQAGQDLSVWNIICKLREMRHKSCQTAGQYLYIHYALLSFFALKDIVKKDQLKEFQTDYLQAVATKKKPKQQPSA